MTRIRSICTWKRTVAVKVSTFFARRKKRPEMYKLILFIHASGSRSSTHRTEPWRSQLALRKGSFSKRILIFDLLWFLWASPEHHSWFLVVVERVPPSFDELLASVLLSSSKRIRPFDGRCSQMMPNTCNVGTSVWAKSGDSVWGLLLIPYLSLQIVEWISWQLVPRAGSTEFCSSNKLCSQTVPMILPYTNKHEKGTVRVETDFPRCQLRRCCLYCWCKRLRFWWFGLFDLFGLKIIGCVACSKQPYGGAPRSTSSIDLKTSCWLAYV